MITPDPAYGLTGVFFALYKIKLEIFRMIYSKYAELIGLE